MDINTKAVEKARQDVPEAKFLTGDAADQSGLGFPGNAFDGVVCQLLLSIVGDPIDRLQVLRNVHGALSHGGTFFASFSGRSEDLNPEYGRLYRDDFPFTGEGGTYLSRSETGKILYRTHHFRADEIQILMESAGFTKIEIVERVETSSRRHDQKARFFYASGRAE
jgi:SAM-dependent methyltransferase